MSTALSALRSRLLAAGFTATSPDKLDDEAGRMAAEDRKDHR